MLKKLSIYIDRLRDGGKEVIEENLPSNFFGTDENFYFTSFINMRGEAYLAGDHFVLSLKIKLDVSLPCIVCNDWTPYSIHIKKFLHTELLEKIKNGLYDYSDTVRDAIFLEIPAYFECHNNCPERIHLNSYLIKTPKKNNRINLSNTTTPLQYL